MTRTWMEITGEKYPGENFGPLCEISPGMRHTALRFIRAHKSRGRFFGYFGRAQYESAKDVAERWLEKSFALDPGRIDLSWARSVEWSRVLLDESHPVRTGCGAKNLVIDLLVRRLSETHGLDHHNSISALERRIRYRAGETFFPDVCSQFTENDEKPDAISHGLLDGATLTLVREVGHKRRALNQLCAAPDFYHTRARRLAGEVIK